MTQIYAISGPNASPSAPTAHENAKNVDARVSLFRHAKATKTVGDPTIGEVLGWIQSGKYGRIVESVRSERDPARRRELKTAVPAVTFSGTFAQRNRSGLQRHSGVIAADFDHVADPEALKARLAADPHCLAAFVSVGGEGVKALFAVSPVPEDDAGHKEAFAEIERRYGLESFDEVTRAVCQLCFLSADPGLYVNPGAVPIEYRRSADAFARAREALRRIPPRPAYLDWVKVSSAVRDAVGGDIYAAEALLKEWSPEEEEGEYLQKLRSPLERVTAGTLFYLAGNGQNGHPGSGERAKAPFWSISKDEKGTTVEIDQAALVKHWAGRGFRKLYLPGAKTSVIVHVKNNVADEVSIEHVKDATRRFVEADPDGWIVLPKLMRGANVYFSRALLEFLPVADDDFHRSTAEAAFFYFRNGPVKVTAEGVEHLEYSQLDGLVWRDQIIDRDFEPIADLDGQHLVDGVEFARFVWHTQRRDPERFLALCTAIGYLLHDYKNPSQAKAVCFVDETISDVPAGRAGKSLVGRAIGQVVPALHIDARNFRFDTAFAFQQVTPATRLVHFNDASKHFPFDRLFSLVTDDFPVERKNRDALTLPFDRSPKLLISTNYVIEGQGGSHEDRIFEVEFSDHFNQHHKPEHEFGHRFFDGWDAAEWNRFDNFMAGCVRAYLRHGLYRAGHVNLAKKKLIQMTSPEFAEFVETGDGEAEKGLRYRATNPDTARDAVRRAPYEYHKGEEFKAFRELFPEVGDEVDQRIFTSWLKTYARACGWEAGERRSGRGGGERFIWFVKPGCTTSALGVPQV